MKTSEMINELAAALCEAQSEMPILRKENSVSMELKSGRKIEYDYLELGAIVEKSKAVLAKHKLSIIQPISTMNDKPALFTMLMHTSGQYIQTYVLLDFSNKTEQEKGSVITYNSRYNYVGMLRFGLRDEDDDGASASGAKITSAKASKKPDPVSDNPADYKICNGKLKGKALKSLSFDVIQKYLDESEAYFSKQGERPYGSFKDDMNAAFNYLQEQAEKQELPA